MAVYVVRRIDAPEEAPYKHNETLCNPLNFYICISAVKFPGRPLLVAVWLRIEVDAVGDSDEHIAVDISPF